MTPEATEVKKERNIYMYMYIIYFYFYVYYISNCIVCTSVRTTATG
jgi:hypothetical protein